MVALPRVLFVLKHVEDPYGGYTYDPACTPCPPTKKPVSSGLYNSARLVVDMLKAHHVKAKLVTVVDNSEIHRELVAFGATVVVIEGFWVVPDKFDELLRVCPDVTFVVRNHSETPFLASDGIAFDWLLRYASKPNVVVASNSPHMHSDTKFLVAHANPCWSALEVQEHVVMLPNYYPTDDAVVTWKSNSELMDIGCFGAIRPLKNHMTQAVAALRCASKLGKKLRFHVNANTEDLGRDPILRNLSRLFAHYPEHQLVLHPWMDHEEFRALLREMDVVTQVSFSETFNIVAADAVVQGVATVTSNEVTWASRCFYADPTDSLDISEMMEKAHFLKRRVTKYNPSLRGLRNYNKDSAHNWMTFLRQHG